MPHKMLAFCVSPELYASVANKTAAAASSIASEVLTTRSFAACSAHDWAEALGGVVKRADTAQIARSNVLVSAPDGNPWSMVVRCRKAFAWYGWTCRKYAPTSSSSRSPVGKQLMDLAVEAKATLTVG
jgi:hypothetical protein